ncbi:hypothetical protein JCM30471_24230 [Desulfuromonas carbonis]|uniref:hypothetical protein n=1 Tax=Desulfuromonas sp. DDH964 TaxID=1823759 RepID=UPI00078D0D8D|nr:hypothetical protein [Desulfuromonas sp. DDH964]AMV70428.1 hypothetical protein DBW_0027 [Desulfuromonas sp. DDH964]
MQVTPLSVGDPIEGRCTKCRKNTNHLILVMAETEPAKVECKVCGRQHKYRTPTVTKSPAARQALNHREAERKEWEGLRPGMKSEEASAYSMNGAYRVKALIDHPLFGLGLVQRVVGSQKIEVLFEDGKKTMRCR